MGSYLASPMARSMDQESLDFIPIRYCLCRDRHRQDFFRVPDLFISAVESNLMFEVNPNDCIETRK